MSLGQTFGIYAAISWLHTRCNEKQIRNELDSLAASDNMGLKDTGPQLHELLLPDLFSILTVKLLLLEGQIGLVKQISALCCQSSGDPEQHREV